ncbi:hypothetical protein GH742_11600 [Legionella sp. MW5194]|uniref:hypothetical protein n=1 Tax=Legionella sp. MW5194 TaxID=2662448 RepID=UPI00193D45A4|nr:hypothetical protein [Legionella sp. MW5194]QRN04469.1 hypothetical protein GH742_11600 [Legionella sp. MW5194]
METKLSTYSGAAFTKAISDQQFISKNPFVTGLQQYSPEKNRPGCSYDEANKAFDPNASSLADNLETRSTMVKVFTDYLAENNGYVDLGKKSGEQQGHTKSLMLDFFLHHKPDWVSSILIVDDNINVIQGVDMYKATHNPGLPIGTLYIQKMESEEVYTAAMETHGKHLEIQQLLDSHIKHLSATRYNPFLSSPQAKIEALQLLKEEILKAFNTAEDVNIPLIINNWQNAEKFKSASSDVIVPVSKVLSQHRNLFFVEDRDKPTSTQLLIEQLKSRFKPQNSKEEVLIPASSYTIN